jgi:AcrR family transcriptional regulator
LAVSQQRRRPGGARPDGPLLERAQIVEAALTLTRRHGLAGMSMRKLGDELGVTSMAIYWYFKGKKELVDAITDSIMGSIELPEVSSDPWDDQVRKFAWAVHDVLVEYPGIADQLLTYQNFPESAVPLLDSTVGVLRDAGFGDQQAATAFNVLSSYVIGRAHFEAYQRLATAEADDSGQAIQQRAEQGWKRVSPTSDASPNAQSYVSEIDGLDTPRTVFEHGLELLIRGLKDELED